MGRFEEAVAVFGPVDNPDAQIERPCTSHFMIITDAGEMEERVNVWDAASNRFDDARTFPDFLDFAFADDDDEADDTAIADDELDA
jgi:hypothetical protein